MNITKLFNLLFRIAVLATFVFVVINLVTAQPIYRSMSSNLTEDNVEEILINSVPTYADKITSLASSSGILGIISLVTFVLSLIAVRTSSTGAYVVRNIALFINLAAAFFSYMFFTAAKICCDIVNGTEVAGASDLVETLRKGFENVSDPTSYTAAVASFIGWALLAVMAAIVIVILGTSIVSLIRMRRENEES